MTLGLICVVVVLAVALVAALAGRSRQDGTAVADARGAGSSPGSGVRHAPDQAGGPGLGDLVLVPLPNDTGQALIIGPEDALVAFDQSGLTARKASGGAGPVPQLVRDAMALGGLVAADRFRRAANSGRIVALAPETMERLAKGKPVFDKAGQMLAQVRGEKGQLSPMRLDKAGAQAAAASNMATLAVTAALSQQLEAISKQLQEISDTLEAMVKDKDRERLSDALGANKILFELAENVRRRGITQSDYTQLASLKLRVTSLQLETTAKLAEIAPDGVAGMSRAQRRDVLEDLYKKERLEYWLAVQVQAGLAQTRCDLLTLLWEHHEHPETAPALNQAVAEAIAARQQRAAEIGETLRALSDPTSQTRLDPVRVIARHQLGKEQARIEELLRSHGDAFAGPERDPHTVVLEALEPVHAISDLRS